MIVGRGPIAGNPKIEGKALIAARAIAKVTAGAEASDGRVIAARIERKLLRQAVR